MSVKLLTKYLILLLLIAGYSCKKDTNGNNNPPAGENKLLENGVMSPELGQRINMGSYGNNTKYMGNVWGGNQDELFVSSSSSNKLLRLIFSANNIEELENTGGLFIEKTNEKSGILFIGTTNGKIGYHLYSFTNHNIERVLSLNKNEASSVHVAGDHMFIYTGILGPPLDPCTSLWDFWCSDQPSVISKSFFYINKSTRIAQTLPGKQFTCFSLNSQNTLLKEFPSTNKYYIFNNSSKIITDSFTISGWEAMSRSFFYADIPKIAEVQIGSGGKNLIVIKDAISNQELVRFNSTAMFIDDPVKWSEDGTKLYYAGGTGLGSSTMIINIYDLQTRQEKTIARFSILEGGSIPVELNELALSPDNKRILIRYLNDLYVKDTH